MTIDPRIFPAHGLPAVMVLALAVAARLASADWPSVHGAPLQFARTAGVPRSPSPDHGLLAPQADPARVSMKLRYALPRGAGVSLAIFDVGGLRIRRLVSESQPAGEHVVDWDLRDEQGRTVNAGVYFAKLDVEHRTLALTLATVR